MRTNIFVYIVAGFLVIVGIFLSLRGGSVKSEVENMSTNSTEQESQMVSGSMRDLVALNKPLECTFTSETEYSKTEGRVYVVEGKVRGNFAVTVAALGGQPFNAYMIADQTDSYVWSSISVDGFKTKIEPQPQVPVTQEGVDYNQTFSYTCTPWQADNSFFTPPSDVVFVEMIK